MPISLTKVGEVVGKRADRISTALFGAGNRKLATWVTSGGSVFAAQWDMSNDGSIVQDSDQDMGPGQEPAVAAIGSARLLALSNMPGSNLRGLWFTQQELKGD